MQRNASFNHEKSGRSYLPPRGIFAARRLTSEFGMGSGVSAWPRGRRWNEGCGSLKTECHSPVPRQKDEANAENDSGPFPLKGRSPRAIGASCLCMSPCLQRTSIEPVTYRCPYQQLLWEA